MYYWKHSRFHETYAYDSYLTICRGKTSLFVDIMESARLMVLGMLHRLLSKTFNSNCFYRIMCLWYHIKYEARFILTEVLYTMEGISCLCRHLSCKNHWKNNNSCNMKNEKYVYILYDSAMCTSNFFFSIVFA